MGKYDALLAEVDDDEINKKYGSLLSETEDAAQTPEPQAPEPEKKGILETIGSGLAKGASAVGSALSFPARALGTLRTNPETGNKYDIGNEQSNLLRPEINKLKSGIEKAHAMSEEDYLDQAMTTGTLPTFTPSMQKETAKGLTEFVGTSLGDPLSYVGLAARGAAPIAKKLGIEIESSILGKGNKALVKKERKTVDELAETALKENKGGSLKGTIGKIDKEFKGVEDNIQNILSKSVKEQPNLTVNVDNTIDVLKNKIETGQFKNLYGMEDQVLSQLENLRSSNKRYGFVGEIPVDKANELKRMVGKKGFKKGIPTPETAPKEMAYDLLDLELKDQIEQIVPAIKEQNAVYKKLIPIKQMAENRLPTAQGNDLLSLKGVAALATNNVPLYAADVLSKSGIAAQGLYNTGNVLSKTPIVPYGEIGRILENMTDEERQKFLGTK